MFGRDSDSESKSEDDDGSSGDDDQPKTTPTRFTTNDTRLAACNGEGATGRAGRLKCKTLSGKGLGDISTPTPLSQSPHRGARPKKTLPRLFSGPADALWTLCESWPWSPPEFVEIKELIDAGIDVRYQDSFGRTALFVAAYRGHVDAVRALIAADPSVGHLLMQDNIGKTPLDKAIQYQRGECADLIRAAVACAANESELCEDGGRAGGREEEAAAGGAAVKYGANPTGTTSAGAQASRTLQEGIVPEGKAREGKGEEEGEGEGEGKCREVTDQGSRKGERKSCVYNSPSNAHDSAQPKKTIPRAPYDGPADALWTICTSKFESIMMGRSSVEEHMLNVDELIDAGIDVRYQKYGESALCGASACGIVEFVRALLAADSSADHLCMHTLDGWTALIIASADGRTDIVRELVAADGSVEHLGMRDNFGASALDLAIKYSNDECAAILRAAGGGEMGFGLGLELCDTSTNMLP
jgi:ankyrin repeat protein